MFVLCVYVSSNYAYTISSINGVSYVNLYCYSRTLLLELTSALCIPAVLL